MIDNFKKWLKLFALRTPDGWRIQLPFFCGEQMRSVKLFTFTILFILLIQVPTAEAISDDESKEMFTKLVHAFYESDAETFFNIISKFKNPQFDSMLIVSNWMKGRTAVQETFLSVKGVEVGGMARIAEETIGDIDFRFDGTDKAPSRVIIVTAFVDRIIEFEKPVPPQHRRVQQVAVFKLYVTIVKEKYLSYKSDEINLGYLFAGK